MVDQQLRIDSKQLLLVRRINVTANHVVEEAAAPMKPAFEQMDLFTDYAELERRQAEEEAALDTKQQLLLDRIGEHPCL